MEILVVGGTGFIGRSLCRVLADQGYEVIVSAPDKHNLSDPRLRFVPWRGADGHSLSKIIEGVFAVVNLAGVTVAQRWTSKHKEVIYASRIESTRLLVAGIGQAKNRPKKLINASAVGYYGDAGDAVIDETSGPGSGFLSRLCEDWEKQADEANAHGVAVIKLRLGVVLGRAGGALAKMLPPFKLGLGGPLGSGEQWMSWIHRDDVIGLVLFLLASESASGVINAVAPQPVTNKEFSRTLGKVLGRPAFLPAPAFILKCLLGEMGGMLLTGQRVLPQRAMALGYKFQYPDLEGALRACV